MEGSYSVTESPPPPPLPPPLTLLDFSESGAVKARTLSITLPKDVQNVIEGILFSPSLVLDLSKRGLEQLNEEIFKIPHLKQLHLQRNELSIIPKDFFQLLPSLVWLDLRHNQIRAIPSGIGAHKNLKTLLMEKNPIKSLPVELGNLMSLKALNLRNCPLEFPPQDVIQKGLMAILAFLRNWALKQMMDDDPLYQEIVPVKRANSFRDSSRGKHGSPERPASTKEALQPWKGRQDAARAKEYSFPPVEKLNLADVVEPSMDFSEDWTNEEEMKQFWKLRREIVANEKAEILANQLLPAQFPLELGEALPNGRGKERLPKPRSNFRIPLKRPHNSRKKASSFKNMFPEIPSYETTIQTKKDEERRVAALKELKEKQALIEQRKRDKKMLQKWRQQAEVMKKEKEALMTVQPPPKDMVLMNAPFATDPLAEKKEFDSLKKQQLNQWKLRPEKDELRARAPAGLFHGRASGHGRSGTRSPIRWESGQAKRARLAKLLSPPAGMQSLSTGGCSGPLWVAQIPEPGTAAPSAPRAPSPRRPSAPFHDERRTCGRPGSCRPGAGGRQPPALPTLRGWACHPALEQGGSRGVPRVPDPPRSSGEAAGWGLLSPPSAGPEVGPATGALCLVCPQSLQRPGDRRKNQAAHAGLAGKEEASPGEPSGGDEGGRRGPGDRPEAAR